jgi:aconitase A
MAVLAEIYEHLHLSNLVGMGVLPLKFKEVDSAETLHDGSEQLSLAFRCFAVKRAFDPADRPGMAAARCWMLSVD